MGSAVLRPSMPVSSCVCGKNPILRHGRPCASNGAIKGAMLRSNVKESPVVWMAAITNLILTGCTTVIQNPKLFQNSESAFGQFRFNFLTGLRYGGSFRNGAY